MPLVSRAVDSQVEATVFIPTYNGGEYLERLLSAVESQEFDGDFEILIIDSGSTDATLEIISRHEAVRLVTIPNSEFGHGKTRNLAAHLARGTFVAYLSHDAVPVGRDWLEKLLIPLRSMTEGGYDVQAVFGKHVARSSSVPVLKYGIRGVFQRCGPDGEITVIDGAITNVETLSDSQLFYSDVCSASIRSFLTDTIPYRDVLYAEDIAFARDIISAGFRKAYQPSAVVEHSNDVSLRDFSKRAFDEFLALRRLGEAPRKRGWVGTFLRIVKENIVSGIRIVGDQDYSLSQKLHWLVVNPAFVWQKWVGIHRALKVAIDDERAIAKYSLEGKFNSTEL